MAAFNVLTLVRATMSSPRSAEVLQVVARHLQHGLGTDAEVVGIQTTKTEGVSALVVYRVQVTVSHVASAAEAQREALARLQRDLPRITWPAIMHVHRVEVLSAITASTVLDHAE